MAGDAAIKTYRYLRLGMVGVVAALAVSVGVERADAGCWQTSISAYYYTPVRAVLVGGLVAIGLGLVVIKGATAWEDTSLNLAGMLAPVVAFVPTSDAGACWSQEPIPRPIEPDGSLAAWVVANIHNNMAALLVAGIGGLLVAAVIAAVVTRDPWAVVHVGDRGTRLGLLLAMVLLLGGAAAFLWWDDVELRSHAIAAVAMFAFLAAAVAGNAVECRRRPEARTYAVLYGAIAAGMVLAAVVLLLVEWDHAVLVLEATEVVLFAAFWLVQTAEHWNETV